MYVGFFASAASSRARPPANSSTPATRPASLVFAAVTAVMAAVGYRVIHALGRVASVICALAFIYLGIRLLDRSTWARRLSDHHFSLPMFLLAVSLLRVLAARPSVRTSRTTRAICRAPRRAARPSGGPFGLGARLAVVDVVRGARGGDGGDKFLADQVGYVVGLGGAGLIASVLYFVIALGKLDHQRAQHVRRLHVDGDEASADSAARRSCPGSGRSAYIAVIMVAGTGRAVALVGKDSYP